MPSLGRSDPDRFRTFDHYCSTGPVAPPRCRLPQSPARGDLRGGTDRAAPQGRAWALGLGLHHRSPQGGLVVGARALSKRRSLGRALRLLLGRRHPCAGQLGDAAQCLLVVIGATPEGKKELVGLIDGVLAQSWRELLLNLKRRGSRGGPSSRSPTAGSALAGGRRSVASEPRPAPLGA